nr:hypothetical protein [Xanthomonadales bacterium]NIX12306.1 hypothetical protein [Xanthomonadales bacterium]
LAAGPGDTILLDGGKVYEIGQSFELGADGREGEPIRFTSEDPGGLGRYAVITTVGGRKEPDLKALMVTGSYWHISRIEISGTRVPLEGGWWDTNGFQLGLYLLGPGSHHNVIEDVHIHDTHNAAVAVRDDAHQNTFRRMRIHHIGEWLDAGYNAHEAEGFYLGSSKGFDEDGNKARIHDILVEDNVIGPGLLGQFVDIKYGASRVTVRNNVFHCGEKTYNEEAILIAGYANLVENNRFIGSNERLSRYIRIHTKKTAVPVRVDYLGEINIPSPTGRDNTVVNNVFFTDDPEVVAVLNDVAAGDRASMRLENNRVEPLQRANP